MSYQDGPGNEAYGQQEPRMGLTSILNTINNQSSLSLGYESLKPPTGTSSGKSTASIVQFPPSTRSNAANASSRGFRGSAEASTSASKPKRRGRHRVLISSQYSRSTPASQGDTSAWSASYPMSPSMVSHATFTQGFVKVMDDEDASSSLGLSDTMNHVAEIKLPEEVIQRISQTLNQRKGNEDRYNWSSLSSLRANEVNDYGINIQQLKSWSKEQSGQLMMKEEAIQQRALGKLRGFMEAIVSALKIQAWWRMIRMQYAFKVYRQRRRVKKRCYFVAWKRYIQALRFSHVSPYR